MNEDLECNHYAKADDAPHVALRTSGAKKLLASIDRTFGTLPFCRRYLERAGETRHLMALKSLVDAGVVTSYPPLCDIKGSYVRSSSTPSSCDQPARRSSLAAMISSQWHNKPHNSSQCSNLASWAFYRRMTRRGGLNICQMV